MPLARRELKNMGMKISKEYAYGDMNSPYGAEWRKDVEYYSDINGEQLDPSNMILADGYLMSMEQFYKQYGIEQYPLVDEDKVCDECLSKDSIEWYIGIDKLYEYFSSKLTNLIGRN